MIDLKDISSVLPLLYEADPEWCIFGSAARWMDGEDVPCPNDIDIMMSKEGAMRVEQLLESYRLLSPQPESGKWYSRRSHYLIGNTEIDISGGLQRLRDGQWKYVVPKEIKSTGQIRFCPVLIEEL